MSHHEKNNFFIHDLEFIIPEELTEGELQVLINFKMYHKEIQSKKNLLQGKLKKKHILAIIKFQNRFRQLIKKQNFFKVLKMNEIFEQKQNYLRLKKNLETFDNEIILKKSHNSFIYNQNYKTITNFRKEFFNTNSDRSVFEKNISL